MQLKEELTLMKKANRSIQDYMHTVKALADEIALIDHPISKDDLTLYILNGLGPDFREIATPIRARECPLSFEELHDLLVSHECYMHRLDATTQQLIATVNFSNRRLSSNPSNGGNVYRGFNKPNKGGYFKYNGHSASNRYNGNPRDNKKPNQFNGQPMYPSKCQICDHWVTLLSIVCSLIPVMQQLIVLPPHKPRILNGLMTLLLLIISPVILQNYMFI
jgi:hypothetical protein